jgi:cardiolipin synthase C
MQGSPKSLTPNSRAVQAVPACLRGWLTGARAGRAAALLLVAALLNGCAHHQSGGLTPPSYGLAHPEETPLGSQLAGPARQHPGQSGFYVLDSNIEAFQVRGDLAAAARASLDVQSYIIWGDQTGRLLAERLLKAADRGVRVRILVDDVTILWKDSWITRLDAHPRIEVRVFNPFLGTRTSPLLICWDFLECGRLSRRMHNKLFAADNAAAVVGGRNLGDEYFAARPDLNFEDLDVLVTGPAVQELTASFDEFWNSPWAYPVEQWRSEPKQAKNILQARQDLERQREADAQSPFASVLVQSDLLKRLLGGQLPLDWAQARVVYDRPSKIAGGEGQVKSTRVIPAVWDLVQNVREELILISPYFVPGDEGVALLRKLRQRGVRVRILTNSLGSTDAAIAQTGYARYRRALLRDGVELYELKPSALSRPKDRPWFRRSATRPQSSLHAKTFIFDRQTAFVGSMNLDHRAHYLNTELGLVIESPQVAGKIAALFEDAIRPQQSYHLALEPLKASRSPRLAEEPAGGWPVWITEENGRMVRYSHEPHVGLCRRLGTVFLGLLPLEGQL